MAREIKFKFWDVTNKRFTNTLDYVDEFAITHEGELLHSDTRAVLNEKNGRVQHKFLYVYSKRNVVPLQYTGLKDKNGVEIYEGDVVNLAGSLPMAVGFRQGGYTLETVAMPDFTWLTDSRFSPLKLEVVGNIYENPELIQK